MEKEHFSAYPVTHSHEALQIMRSVSLFPYLNI